MVAVFTGTGLGLYNTSYTQLGFTTGGGAGLGQSRESQYVNLTTGNLVLQDLDESLFVRGLNASFLRTYNSRGTVAGQGQDGWVTGFERNVTLTGTLNAVGSTMTLNTGDGQSVVFVYSGTANRYTTTGGDGAHDTLIWSTTALTWTYTEGSSQREELYADHASATLKGRLTRIRDLKSDGTTPAQYDIVYDASNRISEVRSIDGAVAASRDAIVFTYNTAGQLASISTREGGVLKGQVSYGYENANGTGRLAWVQTDLTPEISTDNTWDATTAVNNDGKRFRTSYTYVSATASDLRIASVSTSDGVTVAYTYEADGSGGFRVKTVTQGSGGAAQTTTFTYGASTTDVVDGAGRTWTYEYDANRQLIAMLEPAVSGLRQKTSYTYDASGNLTRVSQAPSAGGIAALDTVFQYDANGNRTLQRDLLGNTVAWTYNASNQVTAETRYTVADADGLDPTHVGTTNLPSGALVTRYMYDARNRVRFVLNAAGEVRELTYATTGNGIGQLATERRYLGATYTGTTYTEAAINTWATDTVALRKSNSALTEYTYDAKGRLSQTTAYAAVTANVAGTGVLDASAEIARYTYDAQGLLRQKLTVRGAARTVAGAAPTTSEIVDYVYDGMGRLLSQLSRGADIAAMPDPRIDPTGYATWMAANDGATVLTAYAYTDSSNQIRVTFDTGATRTGIYNNAGQLTSAVESGVVAGSTVTRTTQNIYDNTGRLRATQDATGARMYYFYDPVGRLTAVVDGTGAVAKTVYDGVGRVVQTVAYATRVDTTGWLSGGSVVKDTLVFAATAPGLTANQAWVQTDAINDRNGSQTYDNAGRLATRTDAAGLVTTYAYDGTSRLLSSTEAKPGDATVVPRVSRMFYDSADRMVATLDAAGYLTETIYDAGGRAVKTIRYANATNSSFWANGTLAQLRPAANAANDQTTLLFYNARSQQIGMLDAEGYLTEFVYDEASNQRAVKGYAKRLTGLTGTESFATLRTSATTGAPAEAFRLTQRSYNGLGQLVTELNHEGTVTRYSYDEAGRLVKTEAAQGTTEVREGNRRYDVFGNLIGELTGEGSTRLIGGMTETQIDAIYAQYGVRHSYDLVGRRIESIDAVGNQTWYFYDAAGRQTFTVRGMYDSGNIQNAQGEVVETRYDAFGQAIDSIAYTGRITLGVPGSRASAQTAISALSIGTTDSREQFRYDTRGLLSERIDAENYRTLYTYTAFGELRTQQDLEANNSVRRTVTNTYDNRGLLTGQTEAGGALSRSMGMIYDAFGRATTRTDARGNTVTLAYDRLGRMVSQTANNVSGRNESVSVAYDAFGRVVSQTDALGRVTGYTHSDSARSITVLTAEGVSVTTTQNRFGQVFTVAQTLPDGTVATTTTAYNKDGQVLTVTDPLNRISRSEYDARGLTVATVDGSGRRVEYTYDAAGRVLTRREDPAGLNLASTWIYDGQGRQLKVTDASGVRTTLSYDRKGNLLEAILDPAGLALRTTYTWDRDGRQLTMTQGAGTAAAMTIAYAYDAFGRRSTETVSPGVLNLITTYTYDANDNVVSKTDASLRVTRFSYDAANRLRFSIDGAGSVSEVVYDAAGRATMTRTYAKEAAIAGLSAAPSEAEVAALVTAQTLANDALDEVSYRIYDRDGRLAMTVDGTGGTIEIVYDSAGRKVLERRYAQSVALNPTLRGQLQAGTATVAALRAAAGPNAAKDLQTRYVYDAAGQVVFMLDAIGAVTRTWYDAAGRAVGSRRYATPVNFASVTDATSVATLQAAIIESAVDRGEYRVYDGAGRVAYLIDLAGTLQQVGYDAAGRMTVTRTYATLFSVGTTLRDALLAGTATVADFATFVTTNEAAARAQAMVYDSAGRARYTVTRSATGIAQVSETQYDAAGRVVASVQYGVNIGFSATYNEAGVAAALNTALSTDPLIRANQIRTQRIVYDSAGRQRFMLDATGALAERRYDGAGRVTDTIAYGQRPPATTTTETGLSAWANAQPAADVRRTQSAYDASGRLQVRTDALNKTESFTYDGADRLLTRTDRNNAVWTYQYDAAGRRTAEITPQVSVSSVNSAGVLVPEPSSRSIVTRFTYDALGNVRTRTDNADAPVTTDRRTTTYVYDNRGYQISTIFPDAGSYNVATNALEATGVQATIEITYNALGQAVVQKDVRNNYSYKTYDVLGRVTHEVDQENNVSSYSYNAFGELTSMRRFATTLNTGVIAGWAAGQPLSTAQLQTVGAIVANANDRTIDTAYTALGQKASVTQSQVTYYRNDGNVASGSPVKTFAYNAFGDLVTESDLLEGVPNSGSEVWATAYRYYDALGRNTLTVDALGYVTETKYNATGEAIETIEYARALSQTPNVNTRPGLPAPGDAATGDNRISRWGYDALGRKTSEISVRQYRRIDGSTGSRDVTATYGYDNEGRVTSITDDTGVTLTTYDAIGRTTSVQEPTRATVVQGVDTALGSSTALDLTSAALYEQRSPYTTMAYDAFGNAVAVRRYANGKNGAAAAVADDSRDQVQLMRYDWQGRAVWERDSESAVVTRTYDAADNVTGVRYTLTGNEGRSAIVRVTNSYDKTGRQTTTLTERDQYLSGAFQNTVVDAGETVTYNAFGEITGKTMSGLTGSMAYAYDATGRLISSNDSGAVRNFGYNLAGHQVRTSQNAYLSATDGVVVAVTMTRVDKLGRTLEVVLPSHNATSSTTSTITQRVDRWGNVVQIIDARGYQTDYEYNSLNQLVRETRPLVKVVAENGGVSWLRPVNQWYYDALGRLVATRDANGNLRSNEYDATGRMTATRDAYGNTTRHAYDALGNQRLMQNALGYLTFKEYDRRSQVTSIGDYLPASNGTSREKTFLQRYVLNQNGDRIEVKNALNFAAQYDYDSRKQVIRSKTAMGVVMEYAYDAAARRIRERNALSLAANAPTYLDRESETVRLNELTWDYDVFGRVIDHNNLSGRDSDYSYNASSGQLTGETAAGGSGIVTGNGSKTISYYANGRIRQVIEGATTYRYEYDAAGNRTVEEVTTADTYGMQVRTLTRTTYDSNNRVERVTQDDVLTGKRVFDLITEYDANGNRRHVRAVSGYGPNVDGIPVNNSAPVTIRTVDDRTVRKGLISQFRLLFTDIFRDAEQDALSLTIAQGSGAALPAWLVASRDPNTGEIVFTANPSAGLADQDIVVRLTATETANAANTVSTTFTVRVRSNTAPELIQAGDIALRVKTNQPWNKDLIVSDYFRDADVGDVLSLSIENALPSWLTIDASNPGAIRLSGTPTTSGTFTVRLRATDQQGAFVVKQFAITTAPNSAPSVVAVPAPVDAIISRQFDWTRDLSQVFADPDGDRMQVTAKLSSGAALPAWMSFQYLYDQATPEIKFTGNVPTDEVNGRVYSIVLTATDVDGAVTTTTLTVNVFANRAPAPTANTLVLPPLRVNDNYSQTFAISALFNDPENDTLSLATLFPLGSSLPAWLKMTVDYTAKTVTFSGRPTVNTQAGSFAFDVRATDIAGLTGVKSFSIVVGTDNAPARSAVPLADRTISINRSFTYTLPDGLFTDADGDAFTLSASMVVQVTEVEPGTPTFNWVDYQPLPSWITFNAATRTFSGTVPANEPVGNFTVRVQAVDSRGRASAVNNEFVGGANNTADGDIRFNVQTWTNTAPFYNVGTLPNRTLVHGGAVNFAMPGGAFTEPDGDVMTYSAQVLIGSTWTSISALGLSINATTGQISGTATNLTQASYSARIIASDPQGLTGIGSFTFSTTNTPPTVGSIPAQNAGRNQAFSLGLSTFFADVNNDPLTYSATGLPAGLTLNTATGAITGAATAALGSYTVTVSASDGRGGSIGTSFTLNVVNSAPVAPTIPNQTATAGTAWSYTVPAFTDPNGDVLTYSASGLPAWMSFNATTRVLSGTAGPVGSWTINITATDPSGVQANRSFTVTTPSTPPVYNGTLANQAATPSVAFNYTVPAGAFTDPNGDALTYSADANGSPLPAWLSFNAATRTFSGTPTTAGSWIIRVMANDGTNTVAGTFTISVANAAPVYNGTLPSRGGPLNSAVSWTLPAGAFTDANGDALTYTLEVERPGYWETYWIAPGEPDIRYVEPVWVSASVVGLSIAANGTISGTLQGLYSPAYDNVYQYYYDYNMRITARDPSSASAIGAFTVTANVAPVAPSIPQIVLAYNTPVSTTLPAFTDANGQTLTYSVSNLPPGMSFNAATRVISGTGTLKGSWTVTYTATDTLGAVTNTTFTLTIGTDTAPVRTGVALADRTLSISRSFSYTLPDGLFVDNDGDSFSLTASLVEQVAEVEPGTPTYYWVNYLPLPSWMAFNAATRTFSGTVPAGWPAGNFTVRVQAVDSRGRVSAANNEFVGGGGNVYDGDIVFNAQTWTNSAPIYNAGTLSGQTLVHGGAVNIALPGGAFSEPDGDALSYSAQVLIGSTWTSISALGLGINATTGQISGTAINLTQASYSARIIASDPQGLIGIGGFTFSVTNTAPTAGTIPNQTAGRNQAFGLSTAAYFSDVNADVLSFSATGLPAGLTISSAGVISGSTGAALGNYAVTVTANDGRGGIANSSFTLTVANSAPVAPGVSNQTATAGSFFSYTPAAFSDPNGDALTYSASGLPAWLSFNPGTRTFSGTAGVVGSWYITYTATDTSGIASSTGFWVTTPSTPPVYNGTLANQSASPGVGFSYTVPAGAFTDPNGDALTYSADANGVALPAWLSFNAATRTFSGTPGSAGSWTIRVMASDGTSTVAGLFTISTSNVGPVYNGTLPTRGGTSGTGVSWALPGGAFTDANGDALTYTLEVERPGYWETYWIAPGEPDIRYVEPVWVAASAVNLSIAANGTISGTLQGLYSPGYDNVYQYYYNYNMRITARDPSGATAVGGFAVNANVAPVAPGIGTLIARQNSAYGYTLPAFSDANGNALSYSVSNLPPGLFFDPGTRVVSGTPPTAGSWTVTYTANDGNGGVTNTTFTLTVQANNAPTPPSVGTQTGGVGGGLSVTLPVFTDADYDALSYSVSNLPPGLSFNPATLAISGTPTTAGSWTVTYTANDGRGGVSNTTFTFTINASAPPNQAPVVSVPIDDQYALSGEYFVFTIPANTFTDPDNNPLTYTATMSSGAALPAWLSFNAATQTFSGVPGGINNQTWTIRVRATDPSGLSVTDDFFLYKEGTGGGPLDGLPVDDPSLHSAAAVPVPESLDGELMSRSWDFAPVPESPNPLPGPDVEPYGVSQSIVPDAAPASQTDGEQTVVADVPVTTAMAATTAAASSTPVNDVQPNVAIDDVEPVARLYSFDMGTGPALAGSASILEIQSTGDTSATNPVPMINALATSVPVQIKDEWFVYDAENRLKLVGGQLIGAAGAQGTYIGLGVSGVESYELMYDAVGQVVGRSVKSGANQIVYRTTYDLRGRKQYEFHAEFLNPVNFEFGGISKQYTYDAADRMTETRSYYQNGTRVQAPLDGEGFPQGPDMRVSGWISSAETFTYDADGRLTLQINLERNNGINGIQWFEPWDYDDTLQRTSLTVLAEDSRVMYTDQFGNSGYDSVGRVSVYRYTAKDISWATHTYTSTYEGWEGYVEKFMSGVSTNNNYRATTNTLTYDAFGKLIKQIENTPLPSNLGTLEDRARAYTYNGDGRVLTRREGKIVSNVFTQTADASGANPNYLFVHAAGQQQAELREGGQIRYNGGYTYNTQQIQTLNGSGNYAAGGGTVTAQQGETLQSLAQRVYGNSSLWYVLADANGLSDPDGQLIAGTQLNTPKVTVSNNDANTFRPYDPGEAIGPTSPGLPYITPPPKKSCNVLALVLVIIVAVVVTTFTAGALAAPAGASIGSIFSTGAAVLTGSAVTAGTIGIGTAIGAAAVGGFVGSIASQVVGKALGVVDKISLRSAFASGLTAGLTAGIGGTGIIKELAGAGKYAHIARGAITAGVGGVTSYAANRAAGIDVSFSWKSIAASAVTGAITAAIAPGIASVIDSEFGQDLAKNFIGGVVGAHARKAFGVGGPIDYGSIALDAFGNALANAAVGALSRIGSDKLSLTEGGAQLLVIDQAIRNAQSEEEIQRLQTLRAEVLEGKHRLSYGVEENLGAKQGVEANASYENGKITFDKKLIDQAGTSEGAAGLLGAYMEELAEWVADKTGIRYTNEDGVKLDTGAVNGMLVMQSVSSGFESVTFSIDVGAGASSYTAGSKDIFEASVRLFTPERILSNTNSNGVYFQKTSFQRARDALISTITNGLKSFGNGGAMTVGLAFGIGEKGWEAVRGLATLAAQASGTLAYATLKATGFSKTAERYYRDDFNAMMGLVDSVKGFVNSSWGKKWDSASEALFGGFFKSLEATQKAYNNLPGGTAFAPGAYFDFGRAAGNLAFEVVNIALMVTGAGAAARGATTLGRMIASRGSMAGAGAGRLSGLLDDLGSAVSKFSTRVRNGYTYHLDDAGRVLKVEGDLTLNKAQGRNTTAQRNAGGADRLPTDQGGHYIGRRFNGPTDDFNHFAQNANFNNSAYRRLENSWETSLSQGRSVRVRIEPSYNGGSLRPDQLVVRQWIDGRQLAPVTFRNRPGG
jgi:large repetitive protein